MEIMNEWRHSHKPMLVEDTEIKMQIHKCMEAVRKILTDSVSKIFEQSMSTFKDRGIIMVTNLPSGW